MNAILGLNSVLVSEFSAHSDQASIAVHIRHATEQLLRVVNDILDISQLEAGRLVMQTAAFPLRTSLHACLAGFDSRAQAKGLSLSLSIDPAPSDFVVGDRLRFE